MSFSTQPALAVSHSNASMHAASITSASSAPNSNYPEAFGTLSSSYGFTGSVPSLPPRIPLSQSTSSSRSISRAPSSSQSSSSSDKNYEVAFGGLYSLYGFGGSAPAVPMVQNTTPAASRSVNTPSKRRAPQSPGNYEAALAQLASSYGVSGSGTPSWSAQYCSRQ